MNTQPTDRERAENWWYEMTPIERQNMTNRHVNAYANWNSLTHITIIEIWEKERETNSASKEGEKELMCTPGPWYPNGPKISEFTGNQTYFSIQTKNAEIRNNSYLMPGFYYPDSKQTIEEMWANANLIAAAPDIYKALSNICKAIDNYNEITELMVREAKESLAKATNKK